VGKAEEEGAVATLLLEEKASVFGRGKKNPKGCYSMPVLRGEEDAEAKGGLLFSRMRTLMLAGRKRAALPSRESALTYSVGERRSLPRRTPTLLKKETCLIRSEKKGRGGSPRRDDS